MRRSKIYFASLAVPVRVPVPKVFASPHTNMIIKVMMAKTSAMLVVKEIDTLLRKEDFSRADVKINSAPPKALQGSDLVFTALSHHAPHSTIRLLVNAGCDLHDNIDKKPKHGFNALHLAVIMKASPLTIELLLQQSVSARQLNAAKWTPLQLAVSTGADLQTVNLLLATCGGNVNTHPLHDGRSLLHLAAEYGASVEVVQALLKHGANPNSKDYFGETPITLATSMALIAEMKRAKAN